MATAFPLGYPVLTFRYPNGFPLSGGSLYTYLDGTSTPYNTWLDEDQDGLNTNPIILDANGQCIIFVDDNDYTFDLYDAFGVEQPNYPLNGISIFNNTTQINTIVSNQETDEANISSLQSEVGALTTAVDALPDQLAGKAALVHNHLITDVTGLQAALQNASFSVLSVTSPSGTAGFTSALTPIPIGPCTVITSSNFLGYYFQEAGTGLTCLTACALIAHMHTNVVSVANVSNLTLQINKNSTRMSQSFANIAVEQGIISVDTTAFIICAPGDVITMNIERSYDAGVANQDLVCMDFAVMAAPLLPVYVP